jgi:hypothetical protein
MGGSLNGGGGGGIALLQRRKLKLKAIVKSSS